MVRERNREFNREYRLYKKRYDEHMKLKKQGKTTTNYQVTDPKYLPSKGQSPKKYEPLTTDQ